MDYDKLNKPKDNSQYNEAHQLATNMSIPEIANAQKVQGAYIQQSKQSKSSGLKLESHNNEKIAKLSLNVYTETLNRSDITLDELKDAQVGHTWISLKFNNPMSAPASLGNPTYDLIRRGGTSMGFWPLIYRPDAFIQEQERENYYTTDQERALGCTPGLGASRNPTHSGFSFWKNVPGRVEEPDMAHQDEIKIKKEYDVTYDQVNSLLQYVNKSRNRYYNLSHYNCTTFALDAVKAAGQTVPSGSKFGICFPNALYKELYQNSKRDNRIFIDSLQRSFHPATGREIEIRHDDETKID